MGLLARLCLQRAEAGILQRLGGLAGGRLRLRPSVLRAFAILPLGRLAGERDELLSSYPWILQPRSSCFRSQLRYFRGGTDRHGGERHGNDHNHGQPRVTDIHHALATDRDPFFLGIELYHHHFRGSSLQEVQVAQHRSSWPGPVEARRHHRSGRLLRHLQQRLPRGPVDRQGTCPLRCALGIPQLLRWLPGLYRRQRRGRQACYQVVLGSQVRPIPRVLRVCTR